MRKKTGISLRIKLRVDRMRTVEPAKNQSTDAGAKTAENPPAPAPDYPTPTPTPVSSQASEARLAEKLTDLQLGDYDDIVATKVATQTSQSPNTKATFAGNLKELRLEGGQGNNDVTKTSVAPATAIKASAKLFTIEETDELPSHYVGRVIGKGGEMIRDIQARSGCRIDVNQNMARDVPRIVTYRGRTREDIDLARRLVVMLCTEGSANTAGLPLGRAARKEVWVPHAAVGRIIGRGGKAIRELQGRSQARIQVDHSRDAAGMDAMDRRRITIVGTEDSVARAEGMIMALGTDDHWMQQQYQQQQHQHVGYQEQQQMYNHAEERYPDPWYGAPLQQQQYYAEQPAAMYPQHQPPYVTPQTQQQYPIPMPSPWRAAATADGRVYYHNQDTLETRWDKPPDML